MRHKSAKYLKILSPNSGQSSHVVVAAHGHPKDPQVGGCAAPLPWLKSLMDNWIQLPPADG